MKKYTARAIYIGPYWLSVIELNVGRFSVMKAHPRHFESKYAAELFAKQTIEEITQVH